MPYTRVLLKLMEDLCTLHESTNEWHQIEAIHIIFISHLLHLHPLFGSSFLCVVLRCLYSAVSARVLFIIYALRPLPSIGNIIVGVIITSQLGSTVIQLGTTLVVSISHSSLRSTIHLHETMWDSSNQSHFHSVVHNLNHMRTMSKHVITDEPRSTRSGWLVRPIKQS